MAKRRPELDDHAPGDRLHAHAQALGMLAALDRQIEECRRAASAIAERVAVCRADGDHVDRRLEQKRAQLNHLIASGAAPAQLEQLRREVRATEAHQASVARGLRAQVQAAKERQAMLRRQVLRLEDRRRALKAQLPEELARRYEAAR